MGHRVRLRLPLRPLAQTLALPAFLLRWRRFCSNNFAVCGFGRAARFQVPARSFTAVIFTVRQVGSPVFCQGNSVPVRPMRRGAVITQLRTGRHRLVISCSWQPGGFVYSRGHLCRRGTAPSVTALTIRSSGTQCQASPAPAPLSSNVRRSTAYLLI